MHHLRYHYRSLFCCELSWKRSLCFIDAGLSRSGQAVWPKHSTEILALAAGSRVWRCSLPSLVGQHGPEIATTSDSAGIAIYSFDDTVTALSFTEDGKYLAVGTSTGKVRFYVPQ